MTQKLQVNLPAQPSCSYPIHIGNNFLEQPDIWLPNNKTSIVIVTDARVKKRYAIKLINALEKQGLHPLLLSIPPGEKSKNIRNKCRLEAQMLQHACDRNTLMIALGGGVVGDLTGFIAATYFRGIDYIQIPTTLLAMLDSSVGGKTGINTDQGKNLIGAFWQPKTVVSDVSLLKTLPKRQKINGLIEAIKMFLTSDTLSLIFVENHLADILQCNESILVELVYRAVKIKAEIVENDEKEHHQRVILNFGHTIGHALEHLTQYRLLHGYAVALGILFEAKIAEIMGLLKQENFQRIALLLKKLGILSSSIHAFDIDAIIQSTQVDKKKRNEKIQYVLLQNIGKVYEANHQFAHPVTDAIVRDAYQALKRD